jgi:predicted nucleotidyltransferase component of viral defense system
MPDRLYWNTVTPLLKSTLKDVMNCPAFDSFRLVGGTSLSLQLGHRISVDIDLFTDAEYGSVDFDVIDAYLRQTYRYVSNLPYQGSVGMGLSYLVGSSKNNTVKLDLFYTDPFVYPPLLAGPFRLAIPEEIAAMKLDIVQRVARKKDFWDLHELANRYTLSQMIEWHALRYPYEHDESLIRKNFTNFSKADNDFDPTCLRGNYWELIKMDLAQVLGQ